jgi:hypothetical protein
MSSSTRSWRQTVLDAGDPDFMTESLRPVVYEFSNKRKFRQPVDPYGGGAGSGIFTLDDSLLDDTDVLA